jgi:hypothetical protein
LRMPFLLKAEPPADQLRQIIEDHPGVVSVRVNPFCGSVIVDYDPNRAQIGAELTTRLDELDIASLKSLPLEPRTKPLMTASLTPSQPAGSITWSLTDGRRLRLRRVLWR